tara:strand:+ start:1046 stop:1297 length:252 start_codon:yes stop_codon:yes gene_type:complete
MDTNETPSYKNDIGVPVIKIGVKGFVCIGETPPMDHPHIYLTMGDEDHKVCLYCNTRYEYDSTLSPEYTQPPECYAGEKHISK